MAGNYSAGTDLITEAFKGTQLFGNGAILTILLIVFALLLITRNISKWKSLALPVSLLFVAILKTMHGMWGILIILIAGIIFVTDSIVPNIPKQLGVHIREGIQDLTGITRQKDTIRYKKLQKGMKAPKTLEEIEAEIRKKGSGYNLRVETQLAKEKLAKNKQELSKLARATTSKRLLQELGIDKIAPQKTIFTGADRRKIFNQEKKMIFDDINQKRKDAKTAKMLADQHYYKQLEAEKSLNARPIYTTKAQNKYKLNQSIGFGTMQLQKGKPSTQIPKQTRKLQNRINAQTKRLQKKIKKGDKIRSKTEEEAMMRRFKKYGRYWK